MPRSTLDKTLLSEHLQGQPNRGSARRQTANDGSLDQRFATPDQSGTDTGAQYIVGSVSGRVELAACLFAC
jgi:hypothetical protein